MRRVGVFAGCKAALLLLALADGWSLSVKHRQCPYVNIVDGASGGPDDRLAAFCRTPACCALACRGRPAGSCRSIKAGGDRCSRAVLIVGSVGLGPLRQVGQVPRPRAGVHGRCRPDSVECVGQVLVAVGWSVMKGAVGCGAVWFFGTCTWALRMVWWSDHVGVGGSVVLVQLDMVDPNICWAGCCCCCH